MFKKIVIVEPVFMDKEAIRNGYHIAYDGLEIQI